MSQTNSTTSYEYLPMSQYTTVSNKKDKQIEKEYHIEKFLQHTLDLHKQNMLSQNKSYIQQTPTHTVSSTQYYENNINQYEYEYSIPQAVAEAYEEQTSMSTSSQELQNQMQQYLEAQNRQAAQRNGMQAVFEELSRQNTQFAEYIQRILEQNSNDIKDFKNIVQFLNKENQQYIQTLSKQNRTSLETSVNQYIELYQQLNRYEVSLQEMESSRHAQYAEFFKQMFQNQSEVAKLNHSMGIQKNKQYQIDTKINDLDIKFKKLNDENQSIDFQDIVKQQIKQDVTILQDRQKDLQKKNKDLFQTKVDSLDVRIIQLEKLSEKLDDLLEDVKLLSSKHVQLNNSNTSIKDSLRQQKESLRKFQQSDFQKVQQSFELLQQDNKELNKDHKELSSLINDLQQQVSVNKQDFKQELYQLQTTTIDQINSLRQSFKQQLQQVQSQCIDYNKNSLKEELQKFLLKEVQPLQQEVKLQKTNIESMTNVEQSKTEEKFKKLQQNLQSIQTKVDHNIKSEMTKLQSQMDTLNNSATNQNSAKSKSKSKSKEDEENQSSKTPAKSSKQKSRQSFKNSKSKTQFVSNSSDSTSDSDLQSSSSSSLQSSSSSSNTSSSNSNTKQRKFKKYKHKKHTKTQRILGEFKFERYNGQSDPKIWFQGFENKANLYNLFDKENKKLLLNELYFLMTDKAREYFEDKKLLKTSYKYIKKSLLNKFAKDTYKSNYKITQIKMRDNEAVFEYFDRLKKFAKYQGVRDDLVRDTFLNNIILPGLTNFIESLQLRIESDNEFSSYDAKDKIYNFIEKHKLSDRVKRFTPNKDGKPPFNKNKPKKRFDKKDFKGKKITALELQSDSHEDADDEAIEPNYDNEDELEYQSQGNIDSNEQHQEPQTNNINSSEPKNVNIITVKPKSQQQEQQQKLLTDDEVHQLYNMEKKHVKNQRNLFDTLGKMVQENRKVPLFDIGKYNKYNMIHQPWVQVINESPKQMLNHIEQLASIIEHQDNFYNREEIIIQIRDLQNKMTKRYNNIFLGGNVKAQSQEAQPVQPQQQAPQEPINLNKEINALEIVDAKESEQLQYIPIIIDNQQCIAMVDSGSQISAISNKYLQNNRSLLEKTEDTKETICTGNGQKESVSKKVMNVVINLANKAKVRTNIYVTFSETYDFLIGRNVLDVINGVITQNGLRFLQRQFIPQIQMHTTVLTSNVIQAVSNINKDRNTNKQDTNILRNLPRKKYDLIYADPPYQFSMPQSSITPTYKQLSDKDIQNLPINTIAKDDCILLMWVPNSKLEVAIKSIQRFGFKFRTKLIEWVKLDSKNNIATNPGKYSTNATESLLLSTKGNINHLLKETVIKQVMFEQRQGHSVKPWSTYIRLDQKFKLQNMECIELFARQQSPSPFDSYGDELPNHFISKNSKQVQISSIKDKVQQDFQQQFLQQNKLSRELIDTRVRQILERIPQTQNRNLVQDLIIKFIDIFAFKKNEIGKTPLMKHRIKVRPGTLPIQKKPYNLSPAEKSWLQKELQGLLDLGFIEQCMPSWALPVILAKKSNNDFRMCIDFRPLNKAIIPEIYPIMRISEIFPMLAGKKYFSKLDGKSAYWHLEIVEEDRDYTGFICLFGCYRWVRMPFGLKNAPFYFQKLMEQILGPYLRKFCMVYLDDIIVFSDTKEQHVKHLDLIFQALRDSDLKLGYDKCELFVTEIELLGHKIKGTIIEPLGKRIEAIQQMKIPINRTQLRSFLGLSNYYRTYIDRFAQIAKPLYELTQEKCVYKWELQHQKAFEQLKQALSTKPILSLPNEEDTFILSTDFSEEGLGAILSQRNSQGKESVIEYASRTLRGAERNYIAYEGEILALHWALDKFRHYLQGRKFEVYTDNKSLQTVLDKNSPSKKIIRWLIDLVDYDFIPMHRVGNRNPADALSRLPVKKEVINKAQQLSEQPSDLALKRLRELSIQAQKDNTNQLNTSQVPGIMTFPDIGDIQCNKCNKTTTTDKNPILICDKCGIGMHLLCTQLKQTPQTFWYCAQCISEIQQQKVTNQVIDITQDFDVLQYLQNKDFKVQDTQEQHRIERRADRYKWQNNRLWVYTNQGEKLVPTVAERYLILTERHDMQGHGGVEQLFELISSDLYWPQMRQDIYNFVKNCEQCIKLRPTFTPHTRYYPTEKGNIPFYTVAIDLATNLPKTSRNNVHLIIAIDTFSKWVELFPIQNKKSQGIAQWFFSNIISKHGCPSFIRTDRGKEFFGDLIKLLNLFNIPIIRISTGYPQSNGQAEKYVDTVKQMMMRYVENKTQQIEWDQALPTISMTLRATAQTSTKLSPFEILYGRKMQLPTSCIIKNQTLQDEPTKVEIEKYVSLLKQEIDRIHTNTTKTLQKTDKKRQLRFSKRLQEKTSKRNSQNLVKGNELYVKRMRKTSLQSPTAGPYIFVKYSDKRKVSCVIKNPLTNREITVSVSNVIPSFTFREELEEYLSE